MSLKLAKSIVVVAVFMFVYELPIAAQCPSRGEARLRWVTCPCTGNPIPTNACYSTFEKMYCAYDMPGIPCGFDEYGGTCAVGYGNQVPDDCEVSRQSLRPFGMPVIEKTLFDDSRMQPDIKLAICGSSSDGLDKWLRTAERFRSE
jgi:hypothetical protein